MSEMGANGGLSNGKATMKGKDDDSAKSKKGKKVQFNEGYPLKTGKGGKSSFSKEAKYDLNVQSELPKNAECVMDCEAVDILQGIQEQMVFLSRDPTIKLPSGLKFAKSGAQYSDPKIVRQILENLKKHGATEGEICVIANACPESVEEVFALIPSLKAKRSGISEPLKDVLTEVIKLKLPAEEGMKE